MCADNLAHFGLVNAIKKSVERAVEVGTDRNFWKPHNVVILKGVQGLPYPLNGVTTSHNDDYVTSTTSTIVPLST